MRLLKKEKQLKVRSKYPIEVIKPEITARAMCVYKMSFSNGFYYIGATSNLGDRISEHMKTIRTGRNSSAILKAYKDADWIKFEFVEFVNNRTLLCEREEFHILRNFGLPKCLNTRNFSKESFFKGIAFFKVVQLSKEGAIIKIFSSQSEAAKGLGITVPQVNLATITKYPRKDLILRKIDKEGKPIIPIKGLREDFIKKQPVNQYDLNMNFIDTYPSVSEAARVIGMDRKGISGCANNKYKTSNGFIFKYA